MGLGRGLQRFLFSLVGVGSQWWTLGVVGFRVMMSVSQAGLGEGGIRGYGRVSQTVAWGPQGEHILVFCTNTTQMIQAIKA